MEEESDHSEGSQNPLMQPNIPLIMPMPVQSTGVNQKLLDQLNCPICLEILVDPVRSSCQCDVNVCQSCSSQLQKCIACRSFVHWNKNRTLANIIEEIDKPCGCGILVRGKDIKMHQYACPSKIWECFVCKFSATREGFLNHIYEYHFLSLISNFNRVVNN